MKSIHLNNATNDLMAWSILTKRNESASLDPVELFVDQIFSLLESKLIDTQEQIISTLGGKIIPPSQIIKEDVSNWFTELGGQSSSSTISVLNLKSGAYASWTSGNDQSWILRTDQIFPAVMGTVSQVDTSQRAIAWNSLGLSSAAQDKIKEIVEKYGSKS